MHVVARTGTHAAACTASATADRSMCRSLRVALAPPLLVGRGEGDSHGRVARGPRLAAEHRRRTGRRGPAPGQLRLHASSWSPETRSPQTAAPHCWMDGSFHSYPFLNSSPVSEYLFTVE